MQHHGGRRSVPTRRAGRIGFLAALLMAAACTPAPTGGGGGAGGAITVVADSVNITYGDAVPAIGATYVGLPAGRTETATPATCTTTATAASLPGVYPTTCSGAVEGSSTIVYEDGSLVIQPAPVTVTASSPAMTFGGSVPTIDAAYAGLVGGDTQPAVLPACSTTATSSSLVGDYPSSCAGAADPKYQFSYVDGTVSVGAAVVTVTASSGSMTYGDAVPSVTASYSGFVAGETEPATLPTCSTTATSSSPVGGYSSSCSGAADPNYTFGYVAGTVSVTPAPATVTASSVSVPFGIEPPPVTATYGGLVAGDTQPAVLPACSTTATASSPVGDYPSSCTGAADPNYTFSYVDGTISVTTAAVPVTVTASSATVTYGDPVPPVTASYSGFAGGQTEPATALPTCTTTATSSSPAGTYPTTCSGAADPNYSFDYVNGAVTIEPAPATVTASSPSVTYGGSVPAITPTYGGLVNGDLAPATAPTCSTTATTSSPVGTYPSLCVGAADPNYTFSALPGTVSVTRAGLVVTASSGSATYGDPPPTVTPSYSGLVNGDLAPAVPPACSTTATAASPVGTYPSSCSGADDPNYTFSYVDGSTGVTPAAAVITASSVTMTVGETAPTITASYGGLVNGDTEAATPPTCSTTATPSSPPGSYPSSCAGAADPNYTFSYVDGSVTVELPTLIVTAPSIAVEIGTAPPTLTPTYSGLVNGDTAPATPPTCATTATSSSPIGRYPSSCSGAVDPDYDIVYVGGVVTVRPVQGLGAYDPTAHSTTLAAGSNGVAFPNASLYVAAGTGAGFENYTNLTVETSNGPQPAFCREVYAAAFGTCSSAGGNGVMSTGGFVIDKAPHQFDVYTAAGGKAAVQPSSLTILADVPAAQRGIASKVVANADFGLITYTQAAAPTGTFTLTYGICRAGTAVYSAADPTCTTGEIEYREGVPAEVGSVVTASLGIFGNVSSNVYQTVHAATVTPATVPQGSTFTSRFTPAAAAVPKLQPSGTSFGDATVGNMSRVAAVIPIPAGMTYVSSRLVGGDSRSSGAATLTYCTAYGSSPCKADAPSGNYVYNTSPYLIVSLPDSVLIPGGASVSMPTVELTLTATGSVGTVAEWTLTEFMTRIAANLVVSIVLDFRGYPTDPSNPNVAPPLAPPNVLATNTIT